MLKVPPRVSESDSEDYDEESYDIFLDSGSESFLDDEGICERCLQMAALRAAACCDICFEICMHHACMTREERRSYRIEGWTCEPCRQILGVQPVINRIGNDMSMPPVQI